jgi:hypothetical protein
VINRRLIDETSGREVDTRLVTAMKSRI